MQGLEREWLYTMDAFASDIEYVALIRKDLQSNLSLAV